MLQLHTEQKKTSALVPLAKTHMETQEKLKASEAERDAIMMKLKTVDEKLSSIKAK